MQPLYKIVLFVLMIFSLGSCKKFLEISTPENLVVGETVFSNDKTAVSAISGLYTTMMENSNTLLNGNLSVFPGLSADEIIRNYRSQTYDDFLNNSIQVNNEAIENMWSDAYKYIYQTNAIIEGIAHSSGLSETVRHQLTGEAKFIRSLVYFYLINLYGDVPLVTSTDYSANAGTARTPVSKIYDQLEIDLKEAESLLSNDYVTTSSFPTERIRPNKFTVTALLARIYLYRKEYGLAESQADVIIKCGYYNLEEDLGQVFLSGSKEAIWQLFPVNPYYNTSEGNSFIPFDQADPPIFKLTNSLLNAFDSTDKRLKNWTQSIIVGGETYIIPFKYKINFKSPSDLPTEYNMVFRLAEMYMIRAEARAQLGNLSGALEDINIIRVRAGLEKTMISSLPEVLTEIEHQRRLEFFTEWGHRWFDLKRTGRADTVLMTEKGNSWQPTHTLFPIPFYEIKSNPKLSQNPGY